MKSTLNIFKKSHGLSLVELMVAMVVSSILMVGISQIFSLNKKSYKAQDETARMQESGRYAFNTLMQDIRRAGYFGGNANVDNITGTSGIATPAQDCLTSDTSWGRMIERPLYGLNDTVNDAGTGDNYTGCITDYIRGDILVTRYVSGAQVPDSTLILAANANRLYVRNSLFVGRLFKASVEGDTNNEVTETPNAVHELAASAYYVGPSGRNCRFDASVAIPALLRKKLSSAGIPERDEVANGIEHIQFQYGVDSNTDFSVNRYYNADDLSNDEAVLPNWTQVVTTRFWVLVRADCPTNGYNNTKSYVMGDTTYTVNDNFKRQMYSTTVTTRN
jgi:prepilin-type N-terminal cleavage/methylation domain-containing protein